MGSNLKDEKETDKGQSKEEHSSRGNVRCKGPEAGVSLFAGGLKKAHRLGRSEEGAVLRKADSGHTAYTVEFNFLTT